MCGRYVLKSSPADIAEFFDLDEYAGFGPRFNIPPGTDIPVVRQSPQGQRVLHLLRWGLVPNGSKDARLGARLNNARAESVAVKPSFRQAYSKRRCLIPADGFYEWRGEGSAKTPFFISQSNGAPLAMAGLWESWIAPDGTILRTACVVTTQANALLLPIHERMPVLIAPEAWQRWLSAPAEQVRDLLAPYPAEQLQAWPVSKRVNAARDDDEGLLAPLSD